MGPIVAFAIETRGLRCGNQRFTSSKSNAPDNITAQQVKSRIREPIKPSSAVAMGRASMPAPIELPTTIKTWGQDLGFSQICIPDTDLSPYEARFLAWVEKGLHGEMDYLEKRG